MCVCFNLYFILFILKQTTDVLFDIICNKYKTKAYTTQMYLLTQIIEKKCKLYDISILYL